MPNSLPEHMVLNGEFSLATCSFMYQSRCVVYSPFTTESMLCDRSVVGLLERLSEADTLANEVDNFISEHPQSAARVIEQLLSMQILLPS